MSKVNTKLYKVCASHIQLAVNLLHYIAELKVQLCSRFIKFIPILYICNNKLSNIHVCVTLALAGIKWYVSNNISTA